MNDTLQGVTMNTPAGNCPKCGAPIYAYSGIWLGITPPPVTYSCTCNASNTTGTTSTTITIPNTVARKTSKQVYTKQDIETMLEFMHRSRWHIEKDTYRSVFHAFNRLLNEAERRGLEEAMEYFDNLDSDSVEFPF